MENVRDTEKFRSWRKKKVLFSFLTAILIRSVIVYMKGNEGVYEGPKCGMRRKRDRLREER